MSSLTGDQLIKRVRRSAFLADGDVNYTDYVILEDLNDVMTQLYARAVVEADQGVWQLTDYTPLVAAQRSYRLPARAVMGTTMRQQITADGIDWWPMTDLGEADALRYEYSSTNVQLDAPTRKVIRGENWWPLPPVAITGAYVVRTHYMVRPSRICLSQAFGSGPIGTITAINASTRALTLNGGISSISDTGSITTPSGTQQLDIVRVGGWHKVQWTGTATISGGGLTVTLASDPSGLSEANDLSDISVGDVVRVADQTDWPPLPADYHRSLADATAAKILTARGMADRADELSKSYVVPDLQRFGDLLRPRDASSTFVFVAPEFA